jgi:hypothetical protein
MITEDYCSFEVAKLLKEKGFNNDYPKGDCTQYACTLQMAMKWLREEKDIVIIIEPHQYDYVNEKNKSYSCSLWVGDNYYEYIESRDYLFYTEAVEAAIIYCLENLI